MISEGTGSADLPAEGIVFFSSEAFPQPDKTVDVMCRAACKPEAWIYPFRVLLNDALKPLADQGYNFNVPNERAGQHGYYQEMRSARICVSPFGYGELCSSAFRRNPHPGRSTESGKAPS